jgi:hypothetical protein
MFKLTHYRVVRPLVYLSDIPYSGQVSSFVDRYLALAASEW